jgi:hypothetical protein
MTHKTLRVKCLHLQVRRTGWCPLRGAISLSLSLSSEQEPFERLLELDRLPGLGAARIRQLDREVGFRRQSEGVPFADERVRPPCQGGEELPDVLGVLFLAREQERLVRLLKRPEGLPDRGTQAGVGVVPVQHTRYVIQAAALSRKSEPDQAVRGADRPQGRPDDGAVVEAACRVFEVEEDGFRQLAALLHPYGRQPQVRVVREFLQPHMTAVSLSYHE